MQCGPVGPKLKFSEDILVPEKCQMAVDENSVVLEYRKNDKWGKIEAAVANRFIMSHDAASSGMSTFEFFIGQCYGLFNIRTRTKTHNLLQVNVNRREQRCAANCEQCCAHPVNNIVGKIVQP